MTEKKTIVFSVNESMGETGSGIESAERLRYTALTQFHQVNRLIFTSYLADQYATASEFGLEASNVIRLVDSFLDIPNTLKSQPLSLDNISTRDLPNGAWERKDNQASYLNKEKKVLLIATFSKKGALQLLHRFNPAGRLYQTDTYDSRGYKALSTFYGLDNQIAMRRFYRLDSTVGIEQTLEHDDFREDNHDLQSIEECSWKVFLPNGTWEVFTTLTDYQTFLWQNFLNKHTSTTNIFVLDRLPQVQEVLPTLRLQYKNMRLVLFLHNNHGSGNTTESMNILNDNYEYSLYNAETFDAIVVATHRQAEDVSALYPKVPVFSIPVGTIPLNVAAPKSLKEDQVGHVVVFARLALEKQLDQLAKIVVVGHQQDPRIRLDIYGYENNDQNFKARRDFDKVVNDFKASDFIKRHDYISSVSEKNRIEQDAEFYAVTSSMEGFNIGLMEGLSNGLIGLSYNVNYGPDEMIKQGVTGFLFKPNDQQAFADKLISLTKDTKKANELRLLAFKKSFSWFNEKTVAEKWLDLTKRLA